jgi:anti-repressor protein
VVTVDNEPWFIAKDVAVMLGYADTDYAIRTHCKAVQSWAGESSGQVRTLKIIPERDIYRLVLKSKLPAALRFEEWVVSDVLPTLRKTGSYAPAPVNLSDASALRGLLLGYTEQVLQLEHKISEDKPKVEFYDNVAVAVGTQLVQDVAKEFGMGSTKFYKLLRDEEILMGHPKQNVPHQKYLNAVHFEVVVSERRVQENAAWIWVARVRKGRWR